MDHPNIACVLDGGMTITGQPFFVMELVNGLPLMKFCDDAKLTPKDRLELFVLICHAVQHAHQKGIVHRDLKPANILVTVIDGRPVPKVIDFGVAKATSGKLTEETMLTAFGGVVGTLEYMSPEQAAFSGQDIDTRSDIYSLGIILYELLSGLRPIDAQRLKKAALSEMIRIIQEEEPSRPSTRLSTNESLPSLAALRQTEPKMLMRMLRGELDWIVMKCLEKPRDRRYETANALARDIQRYLSNEAVEARPPSAAYRLQKFTHRNRVAILTTAILGVALVLGTTISLWQAIRATKAEQIAQDRLQKETDARSDAELARQEESAQRAIAEQLEVQTTNRLYDERLAQAKAGSYSRRSGQRLDSLAAVAEATEIARNRKLPEEKLLELRNAAIACLALSDLRLARQWPGWPADSFYLDFDGTLEQYVRVNKQGGASVRRVADDEEVASFPDSGVDTWSLFSRDGKFLVLRSTKLHLWNLGDHGRSSLVQEFGHYAGFDFSPDSKLFAVGQNDGSINLIDLTSKTPLRRLPPDVRASNLAFHPDGIQIAAACGSSVKIRDVESGNVVADLAHPGNAEDLVWSSDGQTLAVVCNDRIILWNVATRSQKLVIEGLRPGGISIAFNHAGNLLASSGWEGKLRLWDSRTGSLLFSTISDPRGKPRFSPDDRQLACDLRDGQIGFWEIAAADEYRTLVRTGLTQTGMNFWGHPTTHVDGHVLAVGTENGAGLWDCSSGREIGFLNLRGIITVLFEPSGNLLTNGSDGLLRWPVQFEPTIGKLRIGSPTRLSIPGSTHPVACSADGRVIACPQSDGAAVLHLNRPDESVRLVPHYDVRNLAVSPDGRLVATASWIRVVLKIWDANSGKLLKELPLDGRSDVGFSPDGKWLATSGGGLRLWAVDSWQTGLQIDGPDGQSFDFSPDGSLLALETGTGAVRLLDPETGREHARLEDPNQDRSTVKFTAAGTELVTVNNDSHSIHVWDLRKIRGKLSKMGLDWDLPTYPVATRAVAKVLQVDVDESKLSHANAAQRARVQGFRYIQSAQWERAIGELTKTVELEPRHIDAWYWRGVCQSVLRHWDLAISDFSRELELVNDPPTKSNLFAQRGIAYWHLGRYADALADAEHRLENAPNDAEAHNTFAWFLTTCPDSKLHDAGRAVKLASQAVKLAPENGFWWNTLGAAQYRSSATQDAIESLKKSDKLLGGQMQSANGFFLAMAYCQVGDKDEARKWFNRAVTWMEKHQPQDEELQRFKAEAEELLKDP